MNKSNVYTLSVTEIEELMTMAVEKGIEAYRKEQKKDEKKRKSQNDKVKKTKKILAAYKRISATLEENEKFDKEEEVELRWRFLEDFIGNDISEMTKMENVYIDAERKRQENLYLIDRVNKATNHYYSECVRKGTEEAIRRYRELYMMYFDEDEHSIEEISELENVSEKTVYHDLNMAYSAISMYLLGV